MSIESYDLVVIGGGPAGTSGAIAAAMFNKKVALIDNESQIGGAGINTGTIPSKTLRESALLISGSRTRKLLGLKVAFHREANLDEFTYNSMHVTNSERARLEGIMDERNVKRFKGEGVFLDPHTIRITDLQGATQDIKGDVILIATGSSPSRPAEFMFEHPRIHDSNEILNIQCLPQVLAVIGAGVIGAEYASTFAALGVEVHLIDGREALMSFLDGDISKALEAGMKKNSVNFYFNERVLGCDIQPPEKIRISLSSGKELIVTDVLVAAGRFSNTEKLNLSSAGLVASKRGLLEVDAEYKTAVSHILAAGDVIGPPALAGTGMEQARLAVSHAFKLYDKKTTSILPSGIYTIPEVSMVGKTEEQLKAEGVEYIVGRSDYSQHPRGRIIGDDDGFLKLLFQKDNLKLLGVHVIGEQATEVVHIGLTAMHCNADADLFSRMCFNYPTLGDLYKYAAYDAMLQRYHTN
jgi:NAD(P) transhydrogenase